MNPKLLVTDLDDTLYNWSDAHATSVRAMIHSLSRLTKVPEEEIWHSLAQVYEMKASIEYAFAIEELEVFNGPFINGLGLTTEEIVRTGVGAYRIARRAHLRLYESVRDTLRLLKRSGVIVIAVSDALMFQAEQRLRYFNLDCYFDALIASEDVAAPDHLIAQESVKREGRGRGYESKIKDKISVRPSERKPNPIAAGRLIARKQVEPSDTYVVGDSVAKDVSLAISLGAVSVLANYGTVRDESRATLRRLVSWDAERSEREATARLRVRPDFVISRFDELASVLEIPTASQLQMF